MTAGLLSEHSRRSWAGWAPDYKDVQYVGTAVLNGKTIQSPPVGTSFPEFKAVCLALKTPATMVGLCEFGSKTLSISL